jgi:hypothetical protein
MEGLVPNETKLQPVKPRAVRWRRSNQERALGCPADEIVASETDEQGTELDVLVSIARLARRWDCSPKMMLGRLVRFRLRDIIDFGVKNLEAFRSKKGPSA